jgi:hypothetical protein
MGRSSLIGFTTFTFPGYQADPAHSLIGAALDAVSEGEYDRLMVFAPPQHGKSELASVRLPAFYLGRNPDNPVILSSYAASLAESRARSSASYSLASARGATAGRSITGNWTAGAAGCLR